MTTDRRENVRELALLALYEIGEEGRYSHLVLRAVLDKYAYLDKKDRAFLTRLVEGTTERRLTLDYVLDAFSRTKTKKMKPMIRTLLRMSAYQLMYMDHIPDPAVCNEAVKLAKKHGFSGLSGFVNGVLRALVRGWRQVELPSLSMRYSVPEWIPALWTNAYGTERTTVMLEALYQERALSIRTNLSKGTPEELRARLEAEGAAVQSVPGMPFAFLLSGYDRLSALSAFQDGLFYVQDISSMRVALLADPKPGDCVIDVCAAPGGKATHLAELLQGTGMVEARDLTEKKVALIEENRLRHGLSNMKAVRMDATADDAPSHRKADILICDLPCSGLGVMAKKTDIRYRMTPEQVGELVLLQRRILETVWDYVKPGGTLLYSTCTVNPAENEQMTAWFLDGHPQFSLKGQHQSFPGEEGADGFFTAKLIRSRE